MNYYQKQNHIMNQPKQWIKLLLRRKKPNRIDVPYDNSKKEILKDRSLEVFVYIYKFSEERNTIDYIQTVTTDSSIVNTILIDFKYHNFCNYYNHHNNF